jgi:Zn finger protein HypA/HybF involved in hydrogenase expression
MTEIRSNIPDSKNSQPKDPQIKLRKVDFQLDNFWEYCDNCGQKLVPRKCEYVCPACGFFRSCSEP